MHTRLNRDSIMPSLLHSRDERFSFWKNHRLTCLGAGKFRHRVHGIKPKQRDKFHFVAFFANEQFRAAVTLDSSRGDARKNLIAQQFLVSLGICRFRPSVPNASDHMPALLLVMLVILLVLDEASFEYEHEHDRSTSKSHMPII
jgi:hypothetical protein